MTEPSARLHAARLLDELGESATPTPARIGEADHPALAWRRSGLMEMTGQVDGPGLVCPAALATAADGAMIALRSLVPCPDRLPAQGAVLLGERGRLMGLNRGGRVSANRSCRLVECRDGGVALSLARDEDWDLVPILMRSEAATDWTALERRARGIPVEDMVMLGIELGLPIARDEAPDRDRLYPALQPGKPASGTPLIVDLASLWAGPLAGALLHSLGARVVKVESQRRPDGARRGDRTFYDLLNAGKESVTFDFDDADDIARLKALIARADIVIEGSRPRALARLGIDRAEHRSLWISITAHDDTNRVGFGDDAAVGGGLARWMRNGWGTALFAGDAIADPLTGLHAALAAWSCWRRGMTGHVPLSLSGTVAHAAKAGIACGPELTAWQAMAAQDDAPLYPLRPARGKAAEPGAHNALWKSQL